MADRPFIPLVARTPQTCAIPSLSPKDAVPKPISWQKNLREMHRQVTDSARTPYTRADIERLFKVKTASAKKYMQLMPRTEQGNAVVVERENLLAFLGQCLDAEDLAAHLDEIAKRPPAASRRRLKTFLPREVQFGDLLKRDILALRFSRCHLDMTFTTREDFAAKVYQLIGLIDDPDFERRYCDPAPAQARTAREAAIEHDNTSVKIEKRFMDAILDAEQSSAAGDRKRTRLLHARACEAFTELQAFCDAHSEPMDVTYVQAHALIANLFPKR